MNQLVPFSFESLTVRVVMIDNQPMFGARDVALALGYADPSYAYQTHCKQLKLLSSVESSELGWENPNPRGEYVMPKSDVLRLIIKSNKPEAERFEKWVFEEVLPSVLTTGSYSIAPKEVERPAIDVSAHAIEVGIRVFGVAKAFAINELGLIDNFAKIAANQCTMKAVNVDVLGFFGQTHLIANPLGMTYNPTELGLLINPEKSARWVNLSIQEVEFQFKDATGKWVPTKKAEGYYEWADTGKRKGDGTPVKQLKWFRSILEKIDPQLGEAA